MSTAEQVQSGAGLDAQREAITSYAKSRGWSIATWCPDEGLSATMRPEQRPQLARALELLRDGHAHVLLFHRPDRLARRASDLLALRDRADREGWLLASSDGSIDLTTPHGRMLFTTLGAVAELERDLISQRTREALAAKRSAGVRLGRPLTVPEEVRERIRRERKDGAGWSAIARGLNADAVPTGQGGRTWWPSSVRAVALSDQ